MTPTGLQIDMLIELMIRPMSGSHEIAVRVGMSPSTAGKYLKKMYRQQWIETAVDGTVVITKEGIADLHKALKGQRKDYWRLHQQVWEVRMFRKRLRKLTDSATKILTDLETL